MTNAHKTPETYSYIDTIDVLEETVRNILRVRGISQPKNKCELFLNKETATYYWRWEDFVVEAKGYLGAVPDFVLMFQGRERSGKV